MTVFHQIILLDTQIVVLTTPNNIQQETEKVLLKVLNFLEKKNVIPKNFLWKLKMQFWQHSCKNSGTYSKLLALLSANSLPYFFFNRLSSNCSYWQKDGSFDKPVNNFSKEVSFFCSIFKIFGKNAVFLENVFLLKVLMENFNAFLTSPLRKI